MKPAFPFAAPTAALAALAAAAMFAGAPALAAQTASGSISSASKPAAQPDPAALPAAAAQAAGAAAVATSGTTGVVPPAAAGSAAPATAPAPAATTDSAAAPATLPAPGAAPSATPEQQAALAGARPAPATAIDPAQAPSATGSLLTTVFSLILVLGLLVGLAWLLKRFGPKTITGGAHVKLVGALSVGARERILVVEVGGQWIVVGASPGRMNSLATLPRPDDADGYDAAAGTATGAPGALPGANFAEWFKQTIEKRNGK
jgi:flagellar biosynthetic protein FliO